MHRNLLIVGAAVAIIVLGGGFLLLRNGGEVTALTRFDAAIAAYDGEYEDASYDAAADRLVVNGLVLRNYAVDADAEPLDLIEIGHMEVTGIARHSLAEAFQNDQVQNILGRLEARDLAFTEDGQVIRIAGLTMREVALAPIEGVELEMAGALNQNQAAARALLMLQAASIEVTGFASPEEGLTGMRFQSLRMEGLAGGSVAAITVEGIELWDLGQVGTIGDTIDLAAEVVSLSGLDARSPLRRVLRGETVTFDRQSDIPTFSEFRVAELTINEESGGAFTIGALRVRNEAYVGAMATDTNVVLENLRVPLDSNFVDQAQTQSLLDLGYEDLVFSFAYHSEFDIDTGVFDLIGLTIGVEDMGELNMRLTITNIPFSSDMADKTVDALIGEGFVTRVLERATLGAGEVALVNHGLIERLTIQNAAREGVSPEDYVARVVMDLETQRIEMASSPLAVESIEAFIAFLIEPQSISVSVEPDTPVPFSQMIVAAQINPILLVEMLNLQVAANN